VEPGCRIGRRAGILAGDEHMHLAAQRLGRGQRLGGGILQALVVVFGNQQRRHQITPASFSLPTSSATEPTFAPAWRPGGSTVLATVSRGAVSTPKSAGVFSSIGFFFAFMILGRLA